MNEKHRYRLGLDLGVASIGWAMVKLNEKDQSEKIIDTGVRLFDDSSDGSQERRNFRSSRRTHQRKRTRLLKLWSYLSEKKMALSIPDNIKKEPEQLRFSKKTVKKCPYELRSNAVEKQLPLHHLGYIFYHLANHRGSSAVRFDVDSEEGKKESESLQKSKKVQEEMKSKGYKTYGQFLYKENLENKGLPRKEKAETAEAYQRRIKDFKITKKIVRNREGKGFEYFLNRDLIIDEIKKIIEKQKEFYPEIMDNEFEKQVKEFCDFEMDMLEPEPGNCVYCQKEEKLSKSHPLTEERRIYEALNNVRFSISPLALRQKALDEQIPFEYLGTLFYHLITYFDSIDNLKQKMSEKKSRTLGEFYGGKIPKSKKQKKSQKVSEYDGFLGFDLSSEEDELKLKLEEIKCVYKKQKEYYKEELNNLFLHKLKEVLKTPSKEQKTCQIKCVIQEFYYEYYKSNHSHLILNIEKLSDIKNIKEKNDYFSFFCYKDKLSILEKNKIFEKFFKQESTDLTTEKLCNIIGLKNKKDISDITLQGRDEKTQKIKKSFLSRLLNLSFWQTFTEKEKKEFLRVWNATHDRKLKEKLKTEFNFSEEQMNEIFPKDSKNTLNLPSNYAPIGESATNKILPWIKQGKSFTEAVDIELKDPIKEDNLKQLPYYGGILRDSTQDVIAKPFNKKFQEKYKNLVEPETNRYEKKFGRIANPVVHRTLNQLRKVVNKIIEKHGKPEQITVEMARELKKSQKDRDKISSEQNKNEAERRKIIKELHKAGLSSHTDDLEKQILMVILKKEQGGKCFYSGRSICCEHIVNGKVDIDHIIPYSISNDNSRANKVVCFREYNAEKSNRTPDVFYNKYRRNIDRMIQEHYKHESHIDEKITNNNFIPFLFRKTKSWRFRSDVMDIWEKVKPEFKDRFKTDNSYIAKAAKKYLNCLYDKKESKMRVMSCSGGTTAHLRNFWKLNEVLKKMADEVIDASFKKGHIKVKELKDQNFDKKIRIDNRHHALDALVVALISQSEVQKINKISKKSNNYKEEVKKVIQKLKYIPFNYLPEEIEEKKEQAKKNIIQSIEKIESNKDIQKEKIENITDDKIEQEVKRILFADSVYKQLKKAKVSRKVEHGHNDKLNEETLNSIYGEENNKFILVVKKNVKDLEKENLEKVKQKLDQTKINSIRVKNILKELEDNKKQLNLKEDEKNEDALYKRIKDSLEKNREIFIFIQEKIDSGEAKKNLEKENERREIENNKNNKIITIDENNILKEAIKLTSEKYTKYFDFSSYEKYKFQTIREPKIIKENNKEKIISGWGYKKGSNFCLDLYHNNEGKLCGEIIRRIDIVNKKFQPNYQKQGYKRFERVFNKDCLEIDSTLFGGLESGVRKDRVYVEITTFTENENYEKDQQNIAIWIEPIHLKIDGKTTPNKKLSTIKELKPRKIILDELGQEKYRGEIWKDR